eukprot:m.56083 g.56083  ORF g.56083 m.56083 type:complete len:84 (+) comp11538_c0_seq1:359-610(+)
MIGLFIGVGASSNSAQAQQWILGLTAGFFLYIALNSIGQQVLMSMINTVKFWWSLLYMHLGLLVGFAVMLLLSRYEENIQVNM